MRNSAEIFIGICLATLFVALLMAIIVVSIWRYNARKRAYEVSLMQFEQVLLQSKLEIQEQTFTSISQELHDNVGQLLSLAKLNLNTLDMDRRDNAIEKIQESTDLLSRSMQSLRDVAKSMNGGMIRQLGLVAALENEMRVLGKVGIVQTVFRVSGEPEVIADNKSLIIFRIAQEALHNVIKHAQATFVEMQIQFVASGIVLTVRDNGRGVERDAGKTVGSGIMNMRDRAGVIGATFEITALAAGGTVITLTIPRI